MSGNNNSSQAQGHSVEPLRPAKSLFERRLIRKALTRCQYNVTLTAEHLDISRHSLRHRMHRLDMNSSVPPRHCEEVSLALAKELMNFEHQAISEALRQNQHDLGQAAQALGLTDHSLRYHMCRLSLNNGKASNLAETPPIVG